MRDVTRSVRPPHCRSAVHGGLALLLLLTLPHASISAQELSRLERGTMIGIRTTEPIDADRGDNRVYHGTVDQDVRGPNGRIVIPRGSAAELTVRVAEDHDLIVDLESIVANGQRYAVKADSDREQSRRDDSIVGSIVGAVEGHGVRGRSVRIPRDSVVRFRLERALNVGVADRGYDREGHHYHGNEDRDRR